MSAQPHLGEISIVAFNFAPKNWALCNGQFLPIQQNAALFSLLGTAYGGNGTTTFALPDFRGRSPIHTGGSYVLGEAGGEFNHSLTIQEIPSHLHTIDSTGVIKAKTGTTANSTSPINNYFANNSAEAKRFTPVADTTMGSVSGSIASSGGNQPHENMQPYLALNFVIALAGIFPSRN